MVPGRTGGEVVLGPARMERRGVRECERSGAACASQGRGMGLREVGKGSPHAARAPSQRDCSPPLHPHHTARARILASSSVWVKGRADQAHGRADALY